MLLCCSCTCLPRYCRAGRHGDVQSVRKTFREQVFYTCNLAKISIHQPGRPAQIARQSGWIQCAHGRQAQAAAYSVLINTCTSIIEQNKSIVLSHHDSCSQICAHFLCQTDKTRAVFFFLGWSLFLCCFCRTPSGCWCRCVRSISLATTAPAW